MPVEDNEGSEGLSKPKKVVAGAALGVAVPAAVAVAKKLIAGNGDGDDSSRSAGDDGSDEPMSRDRSRKASSRRPATQAAGSTKRSGGSSSTRNSSTRKPASGAAAKTTRTREQLYKQATRLKIEGRSAMNKAELERAINRAKQKAAR